MNKRAWIAFPILVFAAQAFWHASVKSPTYDEPAHLAVSWLLAKTGHADYDIGHPPLIRYLFAAPLRLFSPSLPEIPPPAVPETVPLRQRPPGALYYFADLFLFQNRVPAETLLMAGRAVSILLSSALIFLVYLYSRKLYGERAGLASAWILALCPNLIAHGSLVTTDAGGAAASVAFLYVFLLFLEKKTLGWTLACGAALGLALASKHTNLFLPVLFSLVLLFKDRKNALKPIMLAGLMAWFILCLLYSFDRVFIPHALPPEDWEALGYGRFFQNLYRLAPLPDSFIRGILFGAYHNARGHASFFLGDYSAGGWKFYFPAAFLMKSPVVFLVLLAASLVMFLKERRRPAPGETLIYASAAFLALSVMNAKLNIGVRHILLLYPLFAVLCGKVFCGNFFDAKAGRLAAAASLGILAVECFRWAPHYIAYFNFAAGGPEKGIRYLSDSNIDWGQDLKGLSEFLKEKPEVLLSYFGSVSPRNYGIRYQGLPTVWEVPRSEHLNSIRPRKEFCAVSVTNLQGTYFADPRIYAWLLQKEPIKKIGYSIYVYDVTEDLEAQKKFLEIYERSGEKEKALRQRERISALTPHGPLSQREREN